MSTLPQLIEEGKKAVEESCFCADKALKENRASFDCFCDKEVIKSFLTSFALKIAESAKEETVITWGSANSQTEQAEKWEGFLQSKTEGK